MNDLSTLSPRNLEEAFRFAEFMAKASLVPKDFHGAPGNILVAVQWGMELGLQPMQAMQSIAVINGRPALWGDAVIALVKSSPLCEYVVEEQSDDSAVCRVKRRGEPEQSRTFTRNDAKTAGLLGKPGPWTQYPKRMLQMRARSWALRDVFPDVLRGMPIAEEVADIPDQEPKDITPPRRATGTQAAETARMEAQPDNVDDKARLDLISDLELIATHDGIDAYAKMWKGLSAEDRRMVGADEHARLKTLASATIQEGSEHAT